MDKLIKLTIAAVLAVTFLQSDALAKKNSTKKALEAACHATDTACYVACEAAYKHPDGSYSGSESICKSGCDDALNACLGSIKRSANFDNQLENAQENNFQSTIPQ